MRQTSEGTAQGEHRPVLPLTNSSRLVPATTPPFIGAATRSVRSPPVQRLRKSIRGLPRVIASAIMSSVGPPDTSRLDRHHRRTAEAILSHPVSHNIGWRDVLSLLEATGEVIEEHNGKFKVSVGGETETLQRPSGKDVSEQMVVDLRRMLGAAGITAEGLRGRREVSVRPAGAEHSGHAILLISYHGADIYPTDATNGAPTRIVPQDTSGRLRTMHHKANNPEGWYGKIEKSWYAELAEALRPAAQILIIGNGKGHSNAVVHFMQYLARHDDDLMKRIVGSTESDAEDLTEAEILALARNLYGDSSPRDYSDGRWGEN